MTPQLRFPEFTDEWQVKKLGDLASKVGSGSTPRGGSAVYRADGVPFIRSQNVVRGRLEMSDIVFIDEVTHRSMLNSEIKPNDVLLNITGASLGRTCVVPKDFTSGNLNQHVCIIRLNDTSSHLVHIILSKPRSLHELLKTQTGGGKEGLNFQAVRSFKVALPSKPEQEKIADFLTAVDERIGVGEKKLELLETYKRGAMQKIFSQQIRFKDENGSPYPDWEEKKLGEVCKTAKSGGTPTATNRKYYNGGEIPFLAISDITEQGKFLTKTSKFITEEGLKNSASWVVPDNSIIYSMYASVGLPAINKIPIATSQAVINLIPNDKATTEFLYYFLLNYKRFVHRFVETGTQGNLNAQTVKNIPISLPSVEEQQKIADFLTALDEKITAEKSKLTAAREFKKALLQRMFV